jgi:hypothetical protein
MPLRARGCCTWSPNGIFGRVRAGGSLSLRQTAKEPRVGHQPIPRIVDSTSINFAFPGPILPGISL